ncbi:hypothetical protein NKR23_g12432 [Pleurostoma richardsiae]|uniref:Uncharacterized protein n=1 Tax=Pleurostoma richardsiae TaxID=41990 RepID=A0AA38R7X4_9PEZI|nr:hypothetical protein NKR23_g12432 [Pleurostoma richardsiae]
MVNSSIQVLFALPSSPTGGRNSAETCSIWVSSSLISKAKSPPQDDIGAHGVNASIFKFNGRHAPLLMFESHHSPLIHRAATFETVF